ncbi:MAG TPA: uracil-DNA glycosylase [Acidobacteriota bacterium]|nr:uracil-DNA glycosylase [Acidobacteriota bacterium]
MTLKQLNAKIVNCFKCPRLVAYRQEIAKNPPLRYRGEKYWGRPLPGFGDPNAPIYIVGLAPAANGGNRTGRIFTGDRSGDWLFAALYDQGLANQPTSVHRNDGLQLFDVYIGAAVRCAPPDNKPLLSEFENCHPYLVQEMSLLPKMKVIIVLGSIAFNAVRKVLKLNPEYRKLKFPKFAHGQEMKLPDGRYLICSYHPSQQNTFTGKLTKPMFDQIFATAKRMTESA